MGLGNTIAHWGNAARKTTQQLTLDTASYVAWHGLPYYMALSDSADNHPLLADIWRGVWKTFKQDVVPMVVAQSFNQGVQSGLEEYNNTFVETFKRVVQVATDIVILGHSLEGSVRTFTLTVELGKKLPERKNKKTAKYKKVCEELCEDAPCTRLRYELGNWRDITVYKVTDEVISNIIKYLPFVGPSLAVVGGVWNSGGYVCSTIMPICNRHLVENKQQHPAFVFAIGLHHALMTALVTYLIQLISSLPGDLYRNYWDPNSQFNTEISEDDYQQYLALVGQLCLLVEIMLAADMNWPDPIVKADRYFYNPLMAFQRLVGFLFDTFAKGAKKTMPGLLRAANSDRVARIEKNVKEVWNHPIWNDRRLDPVKVALSWLSWALLPEILYHDGGFKDSMIGPKGSLANDSVIGPIWNQWRKEAIAAITVLEESRRDSLLLKVLGWSVENPKQLSNNPTLLDYWRNKFTQLAKLSVRETAIFVAGLANHPEARELGLPVLKAINNDFIIRVLRYLCACLEGKELLELPKLSADEDFQAELDDTDSIVVSALPNLSHCSFDDLTAVSDLENTSEEQQGRDAQQRQLNAQLLGQKTVKATPIVSYPNMQGSFIREIVEDNETIKERSVEKAVDTLPVTEFVDSKADQSVNVKITPSEIARPVIASSAPLIRNLIAVKKPSSDVNSSNSTNARNLLLKPTSIGPRSVDPQVLLGLRQHSVFAKSANKEPMTTAEKLEQAMNDLVVADEKTVRHLGLN